MQLETIAAFIRPATSWPRVSPGVEASRPLPRGYWPDASPIDRHALVTRHNIECNSLTTTLPLGNGEFCFTADATGLQTFAGNAMSHWAWHSFPQEGRPPPFEPWPAAFVPRRRQRGDEEGNHGGETHARSVERHTDGAI